MKYKNNLAASAVKFVLIDIIGDIIYWPLWWYSRGLAKTAMASFNEIKNWQKTLGVSIWLKNLFTPMFAQYDWEGRIISFFIRLFQIIIRSIILLLATIFILSLILLYLLLPVYIFYQIIDNSLRLLG